MATHTAVNGDNPVQGDSDSGGPYTFYFSLQRLWLPDTHEVTPLSVKALRLCSRCKRLRRKGCGAMEGLHNGTAAQQLYTTNALRTAAEQSG